MKDALMTEDDVKKVEAVTELKDEVLGNFSFAPVSNVTDEEVEQKIKEEKKSERMEKLRSYYDKLGKTRDLMQQELKKVLAGEAGDEEIDKKLYEFSHSSRLIADEINKYDEEHGHPRGQNQGPRYIGQSLIGNDFEGADLVEADFSATNLQDANFKNAKLSGADFSGADLSGADLSGADLSDCIFAGATLKGTNFTGANMEGVILRDADLEDAILMDIQIDELGIEELQALVEYLAMYYPHKLNLLRINLSLLDLRRINLKNVSLKGVDFTGVDFTGVDISGLDLSECIITPYQISQALGRVPDADELKRILSPKKKNKKAKPFYIDFSEFLSNGHFTGWIDLTKGSISTDQLVKAFLKVKGAISKKPVEKDEVIFEKAKEFYAERVENERRAYKEEQIKNIEERKNKMLEEQQQGQQRAKKAEKYVPIRVNIGREKTN